MKEYYLQKRSEMLPFVPAGAKRILDVGCGAGVFGKTVKERQECTYIGVEPVEEVYREAVKNLDEVHNGLFVENELPLTPDSFDCIVFNDVLEHMTDPWTALKYAKKLLNKEGVVVCSIPNFLYFPNIKTILKTRDWKYGDSGILDRTHFRFFTRNSIVRMFRELDMDVKKIEGINPYRKKKFNRVNNLLGGRFDDYKYLQYAVSAQG